MASSESENRPILLDTDALVAHGWPNHQFHRAVVARLKRQPTPLWATCALTQLGLVRLSSNPTIVGVRRRPAQALTMPADLVRADHHRYLEPLPSLPSVETHSKRLLGHH